MRSAFLLLAACLIAACENTPAPPLDSPEELPDPPEVPAPTSVAVRITAEGQDVDTAFVLRLGTATHELLSGSAVTLPLAEGVTSGSLSGIRRNCIVPDWGVRPIAYQADGSALIEYTVRCRPLSPVRLRVSFDLGGAPMPSSARLSVEHDLCEEMYCTVVPTGDVLELRALPGAQELVLSSLPSDCSVAGGTIVRADAPVTGVLQVHYAIRCGGVEPGPVLVRVTVRSTGSLRPSYHAMTFAPWNDWGYDASVQDGATHTFYSVWYTPSGLVSLASVPANCSSTGGAERSYIAQLPATHDIVFDVECR